MLRAATYQLRDHDEAADFIDAQGWTDGLPVVAPTVERVAAALEYVGRDPTEIVVRVPARRRSLSLETIVINAVMAGCRPEYLPVVLAAFEAMDEPKFVLHGVIASTGGASITVIVNGPVRAAIGLNSADNIYGPGNRANATIGRAIRLTAINGLGAVPGVMDRSTQGNPGKYSCTFAEAEEMSPWEPLHVEKSFGPDTSTVTVFAGEGPHNIQNHLSPTAEGVLLCIAAAMADIGAFSEGESVVVLCPEHAGIIGSARWSRREVKEFLYTHAQQSIAALKRTGKLPGAVKEKDDERQISRGLSPDDIVLVVAGGAAGGHSSFIPSWSRERDSLHVTKAIRARK
jgi:hypothetical protein